MKIRFALGQPLRSLLAMALVPAALVASPLALANDKVVLLTSWYAQAEQGGFYQALADGLNVPIGRLRKLAEEGRLTADVVVNALMSQKDKLASEYAQLPATVSQAFERLRNAFGQWINRLDESTGFTKKLAEALTFLADNLDVVMQWLKRIAEVGGGQKTPP